MNTIRNIFSETSKTIINDENLGNGKFEVTFIDRNKPYSFTKQVSTYCI